jgi:hypothetical protein
MASVRTVSMLSRSRSTDVGAASGIMLVSERGAPVRRDGGGTGR